MKCPKLANPQKQKAVACGAVRGQHGGGRVKAEEGIGGINGNGNKYNKIKIGIKKTKKKNKKEEKKVVAWKGQLG